MTIWRGEGSVQPLGFTDEATAKTISLAGVESEEISGQGLSLAFLGSQRVMKN